MRLRDAQLLAPGRALQVASAAGVLRFLDGLRLWTVTGTTVEVRAVASDARLAWHPDGPRVQSGGRLEGQPPPPCLPYGARHARTALPFTGGWLWEDEGWLYRQHVRGVRALGRVADGARIVAGHDGSVLVGDGERWFQGAAPGGTVLRDLDPLDDAFNVVLHEGFAWGQQGRTGVRVSLHDGFVEEEHRSRLAWAPEQWDRADQLAGRSDWRGGAPARQGTLLAGPGAHLWDLAEGTRLTRRASVRAGSSAWLGDRLWTMDEHGRGAWLAASGQLVSGEPPTAVPTAAEERVELGGTWLHSAVVGARRYLWSDEGALVSAAARV